MAIAGLLTFVAVLFGLGGILSLSQATSGVGLIAFACFLGILARHFQADAHERRRLPKPAPVPKPNNPLGLTPQERAALARGKDAPTPLESAIKWTW